MFFPAIYYDSMLVSFAGAGAWMVFVLLEFVRVIRVSVFSDMLHNFMSVYLDERDAGLW